MFRRLQLFFIEASNIIEQTTEKDIQLRNSFQDNDVLKHKNNELNDLNALLTNEFVKQYEL